MSAATSLRMRLGPFPNELDAVKYVHRRQDIVTPTGATYPVCAVCYMHDEGWPCVVAQLVTVLDAQIAAETPTTEAPVTGED